MIERPVFRTLPNDYSKLNGAVLESRLASSESAFSESCRALARELGGFRKSRREHLSRIAASC